MATETKKAPLYPTEAEALAAPGEVYRHYKGGIYRLLFKGVLHTENKELGVVYEHLHPNPPGVYFRPQDMFFGLNEHGIQRFVLVPKTPVTAAV